jgi:hypothetical protein
MIQSALSSGAECYHQYTTTTTTGITAYRHKHRHHNHHNHNRHTLPPHTPKAPQPLVHTHSQHTRTRTLTHTHTPTHTHVTSKRFQSTHTHTHTHTHTQTRTWHLDRSPFSLSATGISSASSATTVPDGCRLTSSPYPHPSLCDRTSTTSPTRVFSFGSPQPGAHSAARTPTLRAVHGCGRATTFSWPRARYIAFCVLRSLTKARCDDPAATAHVVPSKSMSTHWR